MINNKLAEWIKSEETIGYSEQQLREYLSGRGFNKKDIDEAVEYISGRRSSTPMQKVSGIISSSVPKTTDPHHKTIFIFVAVFLVVLVIGSFAFIVLKGKNDAISSGGSSINQQLIGNKGINDKSNQDSERSRISEPTCEELGNCDKEPTRPNVNNENRADIENFSVVNLSIHTTLNLSEMEVVNETDYECNNHQDCNDNDVSTKDTCSNFKCTHPKITQCWSGDKYCPEGCIYNNDNDCPVETIQKQTEEIKDCGTDFSCFVSASENCNKAKVRDSVTVDILGVEQTTTSYKEIKGLEADKCLFYIRTDSVDIKYTDELVQSMLESGLTQTDIDQALQESKELSNGVIGKDGTCKYNTPDLYAMLVRWSQGTFSSEDYDVAECQGEVFDTLVMEDIVEEPKPDQLSSDFVSSWLNKYNSCDINSLQKMTTDDYWNTFSQNSPNIIQDCEENIKGRISYEIKGDQYLGTNVNGQPIALVTTDFCRPMDEEETCQQSLFWLTAYNGEWKVSNIS